MARSKTTNDGDISVFNVDGENPVTMYLPRDHQPSTMGCSTQLKKPYKDLAGSVASTRVFIAKSTVGKLHPGVFLIPVTILLGIHIYVFVVGVNFAETCTGKPLVPVYLVLMGGGGLLKCLSFMLQLGILVQTSMTAFKRVEFMSETSVLDNALNWFYVFSLILGLIGTFLGGRGDASTCQSIVYYTSVYITIIMAAIVGVIILLDISVFVYRKCKPKNNSDVEFEMKEVQHGSLSAE